MLDETSEMLGEIKPNRFDRVLADQGLTPSLLPSDTVLYRDESFVVCPTLGSFLPYWYLILPTEHHLNFSDWAAQTEDRCVTAEINRIVGNVLGDDKDFMWFEHGPSKRGSVTGCGVDHAHVHVLFGSNLSTKSILDAAASLNVEGWNRSDIADVYDKRSGNSEYLAFGNSSVGYLKNLSAPVGSQFFRRVLALLNDDRKDWNYKIHSHQNMAQLSVDWLANGGISGQPRS